MLVHEYIYVYIYICIYIDVSEIHKLTHFLFPHDHRMVNLEKNDLRPCLTVSPTQLT